MTKFLAGYKTYILSALGLLTVVATSMHFISKDTASLILTFLGFSGLAALRAGITNEVNSALNTVLPDPNAPTPPQA